MGDTDIAPFVQELANSLVPNQSTSPERPPDPPDLPAVDPLLHGDIEEFHDEVIGGKKSTNQLATALTQMKDCDYKSIDEVKRAIPMMET